MTPDNTLAIALFIVALIVAVGLGLYQWRKSRTAREQPRQSSMRDLREGLPGAPWSTSPPASRAPEQRDARA